MHCMTTEALTTAPATRIDEVRKLVAADPEAQFAISLDRLAYAKDSYRLGFDLVRVYARSKADASDPRALPDPVARLLRGLNVLTGRAHILGSRYGELAVEVREAGGSLFEFQDDSIAREAVAAIAASDDTLTGRIRERAARADTLPSRVMIQP